MVSGRLVDPSSVPFSEHMLHGKTPGSSTFSYPCAVKGRKLRSCFIMGVPCCQATLSPSEASKLGEAAPRSLSPPTWRVRTSLPFPQTVDFCVDKAVPVSGGGTAC